MGSWAKVRLEHLLNKVSQPVTVEPVEEYNILGMRWYARGLYIKAVKRGSNIRAKKLFKVKTGDFVYNRLFAWKGSFGVVDDISNGCYVSNEFPCFEVDSAKLNARFLHLYFSQEPVWCKALGLSSGSTPISRNRLKEDKFLSMTIPLPPLPEQRRIVEKIQELTAKIEEAKGLRREAIESAETVVDSALSQIFNREKPYELISNIMASDLEINRECRNPAIVNPNEDFLYLDISNVESKTGRILEVKKIKGYSAPSRARRVIRTNNVLFSTVRPYLRSFTIVPSFLDNQICSTGFAVFSCPKNINPKFLFYHFLSPFFIEQCEVKMRGGHYPAINDTNLKKLKLIIPDIPEQNRIVAYLDNLQAKTDSLKRLQHETQSELDAFIPSILAKAFRGKL